MDYEKKYKEALSKAKQYLGAAYPIADAELVKEIFPELKESEDEKIRKTIIRFFRDNYPNETEMYDGTVTVGKALAWLEKQKPKQETTVGEKEEMLTSFERKVIDFLFDFHINATDGMSFNETVDAVRNLITLFHNEQKPNPYTGTSFEYNGHTFGMCARDNGVEILFDGELKAFLSSEKLFIYPIHPQPSLIPKATQETTNKTKVEPKFKESMTDYERGYIDGRKAMAEKIQIILNAI